MIEDPRPRPDLTWLRHRSRRRPGPAAAPPPPVRTPVHAPPPSAPSTSAPLRSGGDDLDLSAPSSPSGSSGGDLDLSAPTPPARSTGSDLDLSAPAPPSTPERSSSWSADLDLSGPSPDHAPSPAPSPAQQQRPASGPSGPPAPARRDRRTRRGGPTLLTPREPTVTLDRLESGIGALTATAVCPPSAGDVVLGALYQLADGTSGAVGAAVGVPGGPARSRRPVLSAPPPRSERVVVDLRQSRALRRLLVVASSASGWPLQLDGTLVVTTAGGARVEVPLATGRPVLTLAVLSLYAVDGEFVLRAELEPFDAPLREVARAYGYGALSWADDRTPVQ
ncbi:hypothetical protein [Quadrisphaera setariae]|uniref:Uncharacterized protein n=1 Tax=Quadrisphaera setariae TaxID=2593304 RepID=A0A5C8ZG26_9ACTN|nr:hypothetical protein [Quadrisphaera setariae]TXR56484.1 hypothetical protein FMM08_10385 [Quadrisphaera setariae]